MHRSSPKFGKESMVSLICHHKRQKVNQKRSKNMEKESKSRKYAPNTVYNMPISQILPNSDQPRKLFSDDGILKLADSIRQFGIIQPITVRKNGEIFTIVAGERRYRAAKELNLDDIPCIIIDADEEKAAQISIIENLIREDLNIFEQALAIEALIDTYGFTQEQVAEKLSNSQSFVANKLRLLRLNSEEREIILKNKLTERHARALLRVFDIEERRKLLNTVVESKANVNETEELVAKYLNKKEQKDDTYVPKSSHLYKDISSFCCAVNRALECARISNLDIKSRKVVGDNYTEITILVPTQAKSDEVCNGLLNVSRETQHEE